MNRKNTILIAVMVNAGLLVLLFITALTTQEEILSSPSIQMAEAAAPQKGEVETPKPLFGESADRTLRQPSQVAEVKPVALKPAETPAPVEVPVLHALPPLEPEAPVQAAAAPAPRPAAPSPAPAAPAQTAAATAPASAPAAPGVATYIVKKGDSLDKIAKAHHTTVDEIIKLNQLPSSFLRVGQQLKVPAERTLAAAPKPKPPAPAKEEGAAEYYTVKVGDNPWTIAMKHHMKVEDLLRLNALNEEKARKLKPGDRLRTR